MNFLGSRCPGELCEGHGAAAAPGARQAGEA